MLAAVFVVLGGVFGWYFIKPVNRFLGWCFRGFNRWLADAFPGATLAVNDVFLLCTFLFLAMITIVWLANLACLERMKEKKEQRR